MKCSKCYQDCGGRTYGIVGVQTEDGRTISPSMTLCGKCFDVHYEDERFSGTCPTCTQRFLGEHLATLEQWQAESVRVIRGIIAFNKKWFGRYPEKYLGPTAALVLEEWTKGAQVLLERTKGERK